MSSLRINPCSNKNITTLVPSERSNVLHSNDMMHYLVDAWDYGAFISAFYFVKIDFILICLSSGCSIYKSMLRESFRLHEIAPTP